MPFDNFINIPAKQWYLITNADVSSASFQVVSGSLVKITATNGTVAPTKASGMSFGLKDGWDNMVLDEVFLGVITPNRLWAYSDTVAKLWVNHA